MQTYLKSKPVGIQLLLFIGMAFGLFTVVYFIGSLVLTNMTGINPIQMQNMANWDSNDPQLSFFVRGMMLVQFLGLFLIPSFLFAYFSDPEPAQYLGLKKPQDFSYWILGIAALLIALPFVEFIGMFNKNLLEKMNNTEFKTMEEAATKQLQFMLNRKSVGELLLNLVFISVFAAVGEELFFRGVLQRLFIQLTKNPWIGIIITAMLFSGFHFQFFGFLPRLFLGILLGVVYWYSGSLWPAILAHFVYDALIIVIVYFNPEMIKDVDATIVKPSQLTGAALVSAGLTAVVVMQMVRRSRSRYEEVYPQESSINDKFSF